MKTCLTCFAFMLAALVASLSQNQENAVKPNQVVLKYLGTAGWEITNGTTTILVDPYLSRINGPAPPGGGSGHPVPGDMRRAYTWTDIATPDIAAIESISYPNFLDWQRDNKSFQGPTAGLEGCPSLLHADV